MSIDFFGVLYTSWGLLKLYAIKFVDTRVLVPQFCVCLCRRTSWFASAVFAVKRPSSRLFGGVLYLQKLPSGYSPRSPSTPSRNPTSLSATHAASTSPPLALPSHFPRHHHPFSSPQPRKLPPLLNSTEPTLLKSRPSPQVSPSCAIWPRRATWSLFVPSCFSSSLSL